MDRLFRVTSMRLVLALLIVLMSAAAINPALANQNEGAGTPPAVPTDETVPDPTEAPATEVPTEVPTTEPTPEPTAEPTEIPATEVPTDIPTETPPADSTPETEAPVSRIQSLAVDTSTVTLTVRSTNPTVARTLPADATWTVSLGGTPVASDTFASVDLTLPRAIQVDDPVPYGEYLVTISAGPIFQPFSATYTVDAPSEGFDIALVPVTDAQVSIAVKSLNPTIANRMPVNATWSVSSGGSEIDSDTFAADDLALPAAIPVNNRVPFGSYTVTISAGPTFLPFTTTLTVDNVSESFTLSLTPSTLSNVMLNVSSSDPSVAGTLPTGATWTIRTTGGGLVTQGTFATDNLDLPASVDVVPRIAFGTYQITIDAQPRFAAYTGTFVINSTSETFNITLIPNDADFLTELIAALIAILTAILAGQTT